MEDDSKDDVSKVGELLVKLGPEAMLDLIALLSGEIGARAHHEGDADSAERWQLSADSIRDLVSGLASPRATDGHGDQEQVSVEQEDAAAEDDEGEDEEEKPADDQVSKGRERPLSSPAPQEAVSEVSSAPSKQRIRMKVVAGQFPVSQRVTLCRLRRISETGERGELLGRANERGFEENEWRIDVITGERLRDWFGPGRYQFEWYGEDAKGGGRVPLGRSRPFRIYDTSKKAEAPGVPPASAPPQTAVARGGFDEALTMFRFMTEMQDRNRQQDWEERRFREELASKERIAQLQAQAKIAEATAQAGADDEEDDDDLDPEDLDTRIDAIVSTKLAAQPVDDELPGWLKQLGVTRETIQGLAAQVPEWLAKLSSGDASAQPPPSPYATKFMPKGSGDPSAGS